MGKLTIKAINSLKASGKAQDISDGDGLYFRVSARGTTTWVFRYKFQGKARRMGLGSYPTIGIGEARKKALAARKQLHEGIDPLAAKQAQKPVRVVTFQQAALDYIEAHRTGWRNKKHAQQWHNTLRDYAFPVIGNLPTDNITTDHILKILTPIWTDKTETASRVRNRIELILDAAKARGLREGENPARWRGHLDKLLPKRSRVAPIRHHSALPWRELPAFMQNLSRLEATAARALEMTILTACRTSEVLNATWDEIDREALTWTIPAERMKAGREHRVPLSGVVMTLIDELYTMPDNPYLFPGMVDGKPLSNMAMTMMLRRMNRSDITVHGFRSTFRDWAAERTHYPREVCEMALAHVVAEGAEASYWRSDIFDKRRSLMNDWGEFVISAGSGEP